MVKSARVFVSLLVALAAFAISCALIAWLILDGFGAIFDKPGDPSSGDGAAWAFVFSLPFTVPMDVILSLGVGAVAYTFTSRGLRPTHQKFQTETRPAHR
jgi:hypothetical protein